MSEKTAIMRWIWGPLSCTGALWAVLILALDQISKYWAIHIADIADQGLVKVTPFLDLVMVWNKGISYGLFKQDGATGRLVLVLFAVVAIIALIIWLARTYERLPAIALGLIIGGAIGNAIDRLVYGAVADFISLHAYDFYWYVFNIADMAIVAGVLSLLYDAICPSRKNVSNAP